MIHIHEAGGSSPSNPTTIMKKHSAGLVVYRRRSDGIEVFLTHPGGPFFVRKDVWGIPKGEYQDDEDPLKAARREFKEEVGQPPPQSKIIDLGEIKRSDGKIIKAWAIEGNPDATTINSNLFDLEWPPKSGKIQQFPEVDRAKWFELEQASGKLHRGQEVFIQRLADALDIDIDPIEPGPGLPHEQPSQGSLF